MNKFDEFGAIVSAIELIIAPRVEEVVWANRSPIVHPSDR